MSARGYLLALVWLGGCCLPAIGGDWPTYRHDAGRSGCSARALPPRLALRWQRRLPAYQMAFPNEKRQQFDSSHEPVCAAGILVVGCPADGSVRAYAAATGEERWRFHAEAPVRLAPVLHDGKVLFGADDGRFRCLDLATGRLLWERPAYPAERPDVRLLGNNRLISCWPVRGGPVAVDGTVYFGSGIWPTMGVYVQAVDIATGEPRWTNPGLGHLEGVRIDHNLRYDAGISPQGYLLATADRLVVTNGRSHPLGLNRADGSLFHFVQGYRNGHCRAVLGGNYIFVGSSGVLALADFREVGNKWEAAGANAPEVFSSEKFDQFEGPYHPYKKFAGCDADSLFDGETAYSLVNGMLYAHHLGESGVSEYPLDQDGKSYAPFRWDARMVLRAATGLGGDTQLFAKAGTTLYGRAGKRIVALELTGGNPPARLAWQCEVPARPTSLIAADGCLFAALEDGSLLGFAADGEPAIDRTEPTVQVAPTAPPDLPEAEGIAVVLGSLRPGETEHLLATTGLRLLVVNNNREETEAERRRLAAAGVYGTRVERVLGEPLEFRLPPYLAGLLWLRDQPTNETQLRQAWTAVRPYGGKLRFTGSPEQIAAFTELAQQADLTGAEVAADGEGVTLARPGGPVGAADWTHETADAARSFFSRDLAVRAPLAPLWFGDGPGYGFIKHKDYGRGVKPQVVQGRVFALQQHTATLFAYDAYTGRVLWQTRGEGDDAGFITRFASLPDGIYAAGKGRCLVYDPASGRELRRFVFAAGDEPARAAGVVVAGRTLLIAASAVQTAAIEGGLWDAETLVCFDLDSGAQRWRHQARERFNIKALAIGDGKVFAIDSLSPLATEAWQRRGKDLNEAPSTILAIEETSGREVWRREYRAAYRQYGASGWMSVRSQDDWLAYAETSNQVLAGRAGTTLLLDAPSGNPVWEKPLGLTQPVILMGERVLDQSARMVELATGTPIQNNLFRRGGCNYAVANPFLAFLRDQTVCYVDLETGERHRLRNMRSGCSNSLIAASGILSIPNFSEGCVCNYPVQTTSAWIHQPEVRGWEPAEALSLAPVHGPTGIPRIAPEQATAMHAFQRRFLVDDPTVATRHLVAHWTFAGLEAGAAFAPDRSGGKADCRLANAAFAPRGQSQALLCGGEETKTAGQADLEPDEPIQDALTLAAWVRLGDRQHKGAVGIVERPQYYRLMVDQTEPPYSVSLSVQTPSGWLQVRSPRTIQPGEWTHVAGTFDSEMGEVVFYLNGKEAARSSGHPDRIPAVSGTIAVGVRDGGAYLTGALDDIRIYNRVLGPAAVAALAANP